MTSSTQHSTVVLPLADLFESEDCFLLEADLPGVQESSLVISVEDDLLRFEGSSHGGDRIYRRRFRLSKRVERDEISAEFEHGVLKLRLPKAETAKARRIEVRTG